MIFPLKDGTEWTLTDEKLKQWKDNPNYNRKNIDYEIIEARQWLYDNPSKMKKKAGMTRFLGGWIKRSPDCMSEAEATPTKEASEDELLRLLKGIK